jgi:hypothetical protein
MPIFNFCPRSKERITFRGSNDGVPELRRAMQCPVNGRDFMEET